MAQLFLIGYMKVGKSRLGPHLAERTGRSFVDLDKRIEAETGMGIPHFFSSYGETHFRKKESEVLAKILKEDEEVVVAAGGGTPCRRENLRLMKRHGKLIHITMDPDRLIAALKEDSSGRPKLKGMDEDRIREHLRERERCYQEADLKVARTEADPESTVDRILKLLHSK